MVIDEPFVPAPENAMFACPSPIVAVNEVGGVGKPAGTDAGEIADATPVPMLFIAFAVNVYGVPFVSPVILQLVAGAIAVQVAPLLAVTKYEVIGSPPSSEGGDHETTVDVSPARTESAVGAPGTDAGVALAELVENADSPIAFIAATVNVYEPPFVSPLITAGDEETVKVSPVGETLMM